MNRTTTWIAVCGAALLVAACGGGSGTSYPVVPPSNGTPVADKPKVTVDDLPAGRYVVSIGDANAPTIGKYYAAADGSRLLVFGDSNDRATSLYRRDAGSTAWVGVPASDKEVQVTLLQSKSLPDLRLALDKLAGSYRVQIAAGAAGVTGVFSVAADGTIAPGNSDCKLSGTLAAGTLPNALKLSLVASSNCGGLPASASGVLAFDSDYAPASFRLLGDNGTALVDLWAYRE